MRSRPLPFDPRGFWRVFLPRMAVWWTPSLLVDLLIAVRWLQGRVPGGDLAGLLLVNALLLKSWGLAIILIQRSLLKRARLTWVQGGLRYRKPRGEWSSEHYSEPVWEYEARAIRRFRVTPRWVRIEGEIWREGRDLVSGAQTRTPRRVEELRIPRCFKGLEELAASIPAQGSGDA